MNNTDEKCAFVEDINECDNLPDDWQKAEEIGCWGKICPSLDYEWIVGIFECE